jgi:dethiobiotin synthetase
LLHAFAAHGLRVTGMKPVAAGCLREGERCISEDAVLLQRAGNVSLSLSQINPYAFEHPLSPNIAAAMMGAEIMLPSILASFQALRAQVDMVIVEGVGGFRVPLNDREDTGDLAQRLGLPVILVVGMRLGCLNHALLTAEAIMQRGLTLAGWVGNCIDPDMAAFEENLAALKARLPAPCLWVIPNQKSPDIIALATGLDVIEWVKRHNS